MLGFRHELADFLAALAAGGVFDAGVGIDSGRLYFENCSLDVLRRQSTGENNRSVGKFHQPPAHAPVVRLAGGARCAGCWIEGVGNERIDERR